MNCYFIYISKLFYSFDSVLKNELDSYFIDSHIIDKNSILVKTKRNKEEVKSILYTKIIFIPAQTNIIVIKIDNNYTG